MRNVYKGNISSYFLLNPVNLSYYLENIVQDGPQPITQPCLFIPQILTVYAPGTVVAAGDTVVGKARHGPCAHETCRLAIATNTKEIITQKKPTLFPNYSELLKRK